MKETNAGTTTGLFGNLLKDNIIRVRTRSSEMRLVTLPELLALLMADDIESLMALRPHQKQALHCFLAQVSAMAMLAADECDLSGKADRWADLLRNMTPGFEQDEPWCLVVDDWLKPAFMQAPVPEGSWDPPKDDPVAFTPDQIDIPSGSKHHEIKSFAILNDDPSAWFFSLITLQTQQGYFGSGNHGISRMKSGAALRPFVGATDRQARLGAAVRRDIITLIKDFPSARQSPLYSKGPNDIQLAWVEAWDGVSQLAPERLHPYFVELCRQIRLKLVECNVVACRSKSKAKRIAMPDALRGAVGDPWAPVKLGGAPEVFSVRNKTFQGIGYRLVADVIDPRKFEMSPLGRRRSDEFQNGFELLFMLLPRDEGKTYGYHERRVTISPEVADVLGHDPSSTRLSDLANERVSNVTRASDALLFSLRMLLEGAPKELKRRRRPEEIKRTNHFITQFERAVDEDFFGHLFEEVAAPLGSEAARACRKRWIEIIWQRARDALAAAEAGSPLSGVRRYRARATAEGLLDGAIVNAFPDLLKRKPAA